MKKNEKKAGASSSKNEKTKRKLDFEKKKKPGLLVLSKKVFYLDIKDSRQMRNLEGKLKQLGGTVEKFLSKEINYIITSNAQLPKQRIDRKGGTGDSPNPTNASTPSPFNLGQSPSPNGVGEIKKIENVPRGKTLAKIASGQKSPNTVLENAEKIGIKVVSYEQSIKYVEKEIAKLKMLPETSKQATKKKPSTSRNKVQTLKPPFIKFESESCQYRPIMQELESWPHLNVETARGTCPFDGRPLGHAQRSERGEKDDMNAEKIGPNTPKCQQGLNHPNTPQDEEKRTYGRVNDDSTSKLLGFPILTAGEIKREREKKRRAARRQGYCEACKEKFNDIDQHLLGEHHKQFVRNKANFQNLDRLIESGASTATFISSVILRHCVLKAKEKPKSQSNDEIVLHKIKHPEESSFKMEHMQTPKKKVLPLRMNKTLVDTEDCDNTNDSRKNVKENVLTLQPLHMIEMSQICPKHKKDRSLCQCTVKLSSLGRQLAQSCSPRRSLSRQLVQSYSPNRSVKRLGDKRDLKTLKLPSALVLKNSHRELYDSPTRPNLTNFRKSSRQEMVIGNSQIASLQTVESVYNQYSNQITSDDYMEDTNRGQKTSSEIKFKPDDETSDIEKSENENLSTADKIAVLDKQQSKDCKLKNLTRHGRVQKLNCLSNCNTDQECDVELEKRFVENEKSITVCRDASVNVKNNELASENINSSSVLTKKERELSLQAADSITAKAVEDNQLDRISKEVSSKPWSTRTSRIDISEQMGLQNVSIGEKQNPVFEETRIAEFNELTTTVEKMKVADKPKSADFNKKDLLKLSKNCEGRKLSLLKRKENTETSILLFYESAAERVKNRRARTPSVASSNTPSGSVRDENISENDRSSQQLPQSISNLNQTKTSSHGKSVGRSQKQRFRHWSGRKSKPAQNENNSLSHTDGEKKRLAKLKFPEFQMIDCYKCDDDVQSCEVIGQKDGAYIDCKEDFLQKESKELSVDSMSPKYKKRLNKVNCENRLDNRELNSLQSKSSSPVFKRSPRYCKKTSVPISPISFSINKMVTVKKKENWEADHKRVTTDITKHNGFLRTPMRLAKRVLLKGDVASNETSVPLSIGEKDDVRMHPSPDKSEQIEDEKWDSPKSGFSMTPRGKHLARRKLHSNDNQLKSNKCKKGRLKFQEKETNFDAQKKSSEKISEEYEGSLLEAGTNVSSHVKHSVHKDIHKEQNVEMKSVLSSNVKNCLKGSQTSPCFSTCFVNANRCGNVKKRKWMDVNNTSTSSKPGSSTKKVKLNRSWLILSERSMGRLLESEVDAPPFHGYNGQLMESKLPSDMTYEELSEVEVSDDSDKEWIIEDDSSHDNVNHKSDGLEEEEFNKYLPLLTSPGKATDSSWGDACDTFLKTTYDKHSTSYGCSTPFNVDAKQDQKKNQRSKHRGQKKAKLKHKADVSDVIQLSDRIDHDPTTPLKQRNPTGLDCGVEQIDEDIVFNFCSPQKDKREFSPLRKEDACRFVANRCDVSSAQYKISNKLEQVSSPVRQKNKEHKKKQHSQNGYKNVSKAKKSIHSEFEHVKRTPSKSKKETFS